MNLITTTRPVRYHGWTLPAGTTATVRDWHRDYVGGAWVRNAVIRIGDDHDISIPWDSYRIDRYALDA